MSSSLIQSHSTKTKWRWTISYTYMMKWTFPIHLWFKSNHKSGIAPKTLVIIIINIVIIILIIINNNTPTWTFLVKKRCCDISNQNVIHSYCNFFVILFCREGTSSTHTSVNSYKHSEQVGLVCKQEIRTTKKESDRKKTFDSFWSI